MKEITNFALSLELVSGKELVRLDIVNKHCGYGYYKSAKSGKIEEYRIFDNGIVEKVEA